MAMTPRSTAREQSRSRARRTSPRAAAASRLPPNRLARNDARNGRFAQRNRAPVRVQHAPEPRRTSDADDRDAAYRRRYVHERFTPHQIACALRASKGGIAATARVLKCTRQTVVRYLDVYPELRETAQEELELALDLAEHSLFVDAANGDPKARQFLLLTRGRSRGYVLYKESAPASGQPDPTTRDSAVVVVGGSKAEYLEGLSQMREAESGEEQGASIDATANSATDSAQGDAGIPLSLQDTADARGAVPTARVAPTGPPPGEGHAVRDRREVRAGR